jgi:hypothetical protein
MHFIISKNSRNCRKYSCTLAIHENVVVFQFFLHIKKISRDWNKILIWRKIAKNWAFSWMAQQPQNTILNEVKHAILDDIVYTIPECCGVSIKIGAEKAPNDARWNSRWSGFWPYAVEDRLQVVLPVYISELQSRRSLEMAFASLCDLDPWRICGLFTGVVRDLH